MLIDVYSQLFNLLINHIFFNSAVGTERQSAQAVPFINCPDQPSLPSLITSCINARLVWEQVGT